MIDLRETQSASPLIHQSPVDPGVNWIRDDEPAIEAPPDGDPHPAPDAVWPRDAKRTGICGAVCPRVLLLPNGGYRMYYCQILPRPGHPAGANDYDNSSVRVLSAVSQDGRTWTPEPGVRLSPQDGGAGDYRVVSSEVVPTADGRLRMYYECCRGPQTVQSTILSAISDDGLTWKVEQGVRLLLAGRNLASPRIVHFPDGTCRLYVLDRGRGILSAASKDGLIFTVEPGLRIGQGGQYDTMTAFAPEIIQVGDRYVMYYAGYSALNRAFILRAESADGLDWKKSPVPALSPGGRWDAAKCSEMCVYPLPPDANGRVKFHLLYEACDGTAVNERGVWRIAGATSA